MRWVKFICITLVIFLVFGALLPRLAQVEQLEIVRHNIENDIDATAYFYSDIDDFDRFEKALRATNDTDS
jgi:hypothetical protein